MPVFLLSMQRLILRALRWLLSGLPYDGTCGMPQHVGDLLMSDEHTCILYLTSNLERAAL